jgi:hypothetical protein
LRSGLLTDVVMLLQAMHVRQLQPLLCRLKMERNDPAQSISLEDYDWLKTMERKLDPFFAEFKEAALRDLHDR